MAKRDDVRREAHGYVADLIRWGMEHGDETLNELCDRFGVEPVLTELGRQADYHERYAGERE